MRGKLTALPSMRVIGSNSSAQYRSTSKSPREIGRELGVDYLLAGKVRWQKGASGAASRVQVSPELIDVRRRDAKWQQPFDASITDVFQVQADIAGRVAQALDVAIGSRQQRALENRPTRNLAAYDAYLKGQAQRALGNVPGPAPRGHQVLRAGGGARFELRGGVGRASSANSLPVQQRHADAGGGGPVALRRRAGAGAGSAEYRGVRRAGELPPAGHRNDARAVEQYTKGLALAPNDVELLRFLGTSEPALGRWDEAVEHMRRARSLDPRSALVADALGTTLLHLRRYDEAAEAAQTRRWRSSRPT